jgi:hypothetical protein
MSSSPQKRVPPEAVQEAADDDAPQGKRTKPSGDDAADAAAALMESLSAQQITKLMSEEGPVVKVVLLKADGTSEELDADMSPKKAATQDILGGPVSFVGQYPELDIVVIMRRKEHQADLPENQHKLPYVVAAAACCDVRVTAADSRASSCLLASA